MGLAEFLPDQLEGRSATDFMSGLGQAMSRVGTQVRRFDGWENVWSNLGVAGKDHRLASQFKRRDQILTREETEAMYSEDPLFARYIDAIPEHCTRRWIKLTGDSGDRDEDAGFSKDVLHYLKKIQAREAIYEWVRLDRLDGGSVLIIGANDGQSPDKPLNKKRIQTVEHLNILSRYEVLPTQWDMDPNSPTFRQPQYYQFTMPFAPVALQQIHASRVLRLTGIRTTERQMISNNGWGLKCADRVYEGFRKFGAIWDYVEGMFKGVIQEVMQIDGLNDLLNADDGNELLLKRLAIIGMCSSVFNMIITDKNETYDKRTQAFSGVEGMLVRSMDYLSGVTGHPVSELFGQANGGLSTDDKSGRANFFDKVKNYQEVKLERPLDQIVECVLLAKDGPTGGRMPDTVTVHFLPLVETTDAERAATNLVKAQIDEKLINNRQISSEEARTRLRNDETSEYQLDPDMPDELTPEGQAEIQKLMNPQPDPESEVPTENAV